MNRAVSISELNQTRNGHAARIRFYDGTTRVTEWTVAARNGKAPTASSLQTARRSPARSCDVEAVLQRKAFDSDLSPSGAPSIVHEVLRSPGQPLDVATRSLFEPRFGMDFSAVRVHTDSNAAQSARAVNSLAYTVGQDVVFGANRYAPQTYEGQQLMAHELTHVVQQHKGTNTPGAGLRVGPEMSPAERESRAVAGMISHSGTASPGLAAPIQVMREVPPTSTASSVSAPNATQLSPEELAQQCNDPGIMIFPYRGTRAGAAPIIAERQGDFIYVRQPGYVRYNPDFSAQTSTLPIEAFLGGVKLRPDEMVRVHTYTPKWYNLNILGSVWGDEEEEHCLNGEQMLRVSDLSAKDTLLGMGLTGVETFSLFVPLGKLAAAALKPILGSLKGPLAALMIGTAEAAPTAIGGIASAAPAAARGVGGEAVTILVEGQATREIAGIAFSETVEQTIVQATERGVVIEAAPLVGEVADVAARGGAAVTANLASGGMVPTPPLAGVLEPSGIYIDQVPVPPAPSPQVLGQLIEAPIRARIAKFYGFNLPAKNPSATGPDVTVPPADIARVGFEIGDIKPFNEAGQGKFFDQLDNWRDHGWVGGPASWQGRAALFFYDQLTGHVWLYGIYEVKPGQTTGL